MPSMINNQDYIVLQFACWELNYRMSKMSQKFDFEVFSEMNAALESASFGEVIISISLFIVLLCHILVELSYVHNRMSN